MPPAVWVDLHILRDHMRRLISAAGEVDETDLKIGRLIGVELLPGWYDDWVQAERELLRQLQLHALESLSELLADRGRYVEALEAALEAVRIEPLRESASRAVIAVHLAEGNLAEAVRHYRTFREQLRAELGVQPSAQIAAMMEGHQPAGPSAREANPWPDAAVGGPHRTRPPLPLRWS